MTIPDAYQEDWELFIKKADLDETYPADILLDFMREFVEEHRSELVEESEDKPKKVIVKKAAPKKKSFLARKAKIVKKKEVDDDDDSPDITQTPKFRLLELVRENAGEEGITPENLTLISFFKSVIIKFTWFEVIETEFFLTMPPTLYFLL